MENGLENRMNGMEKKIAMVHGSGGSATAELIAEVFAKEFDNDILNQMEDSALVPVSGQIAVTTDSFVVTPVEFPGGDIGRLAVCGTVNDLLARGAQPRYLTCGFILQEGVPLEQLQRIVHSMAHKTGAAFSTGHIPHGCANAIYLPYVIKYNAHEPEAKRRYADIARRVGLGGTSEESQVNALCEKIKEFNRTLNIPSTLKEFGIDEAEFNPKWLRSQQTLWATPAQAPTPDPSHRSRWKSSSSAPTMEQR